MTKWLLYSWVLACACGLNAFAQTAFGGTAATSQDDACFKDSPDAPVWADHLQAMLSVLHTNSTEADFNNWAKSFDMIGVLNKLQKAPSPLTVSLAAITNHTTRVVNDSSVPTPIVKGALVRSIPGTSGGPPVPIPEPSPALRVYQPIQQNEEPEVVKMAQSVGRLQLRDEGPNGPEWVGLGTAFVVAPGVIATNCHVISDYVTGGPGNWELYWKYAKNLAVDFGDTGIFSPGHGFEVTGMFSPPEETGLDVVFLSVKTKSSNGSVMPDPIPLSGQKLLASSIPPTLKSVALIGYPNPSDVLDEHTEEFYRAFGPLRYNKFVVPGGITTVQACKAPLDIVLDTVSTTAGQSGSPLIDRKSHLVVGVHTCCADYILRASNASLPLDRFSCASKRDTVSNQAVSTWSIWNEPALAKVLSEHGIAPADTIPGGH